MELVRLGGAPHPVWEVRRGGSKVATASLGAGSVREARHLRLQVESEHRRRGIGSWLLAAVTEEAGSAGCQVLEAMVVRGSAGEVFAAQHGAVVGDELVDAVLQMDQVEVARLEELAAGVPDGYELTRWCDPAPEPRVHSYADAKRVISDAPNRFPPPTPDWTAAEVRQAERRRRDRGATMWITAALYDAEVVAFTEVVTTASPQAEQHDTGVVASHRRKGLARCVKADLILRLRVERPGVHTIAVTYAVANTGMHAVNRDLGFRPHGRRDLWRLLIG